MNICKHGINVEDCSFCSGYYDNIQQARQERYNRRLNYIKKLKEYQAESMISAERFKYPIENWEINEFLNNTSENKDIDVLYNLALNFKRSFNAMMWWWYNSYKANPDGNHHAIAIIRRLKKHKENLKGVLTFN